MRRKQKQWIVLLVVFCLCWGIFSLFSASAHDILDTNDVSEQGTLKDIRGHWAETLLNKWTGRGLISAYADNLFLPDQFITRAEFTALIKSVFGFTEKTEASCIKTIGGEELGDNMKVPDSLLSREEAASIAVKLFSFADNSLSNSVNNNYLAKFVDQADISAESTRMVNAVVGKGWMNGYSDSTFRPTRALTRAEAVSFLDRAAGTICNKAGKYGPEQGRMMIEGNVIINTENIILQNVVITGNLYLTEGIGTGCVSLDNVTVQGFTKKALEVKVVYLSGNEPTLLGRWNLNEGSGTAVYDISGHNNHGIISEAPWEGIFWGKTGVAGTCLSFSGGSVEIPYNKTVAPRKAITLEAWVNLDNTSSWQRVIAKSNKQQGFDYLFLVGNADDIRFIIGINEEEAGISAGEITTGVWHHLVGTYDGSELRIYVDGELKGRTAVTGEIDSRPNALILGHDNMAECFEGYLDEVALFNYALTPEEVFYHYQNPGEW